MIDDLSRRRRDSSQHARAFWWRLVDNAFRRVVWLLIPVIAFGMLGLAQASKALSLYRATGVLSSSSNPLVPSQQPDSGPNLWESSAASASRIMNEQLRTDSFVLEVADRAGLGDYARTDPFGIDVIRDSVRATAGGTSLVSVSARWADPQTSYDLVTATIDAYQAFVADTVASNSSEAIQFYQDQLAEYQQRADDAENDLLEYVDKLPEIPEGESRPLADQLALGRLSNTLDELDTRVSDIEQQIEDAQLTVATSTSEAGRIITVIDPPKVPDSPESTLIPRITTVVSFTVLGLVVSIGALLVSTALDQTVASPADLVELEWVPLAATVPMVDFALAGQVPPRGRRQFLRRRFRRRRFPRRRAEAI